jgi:hypothetical protein
MMCGQLLEQIRECQSAELDFQNAHAMIMNAVTLDEARAARTAVRVALKKRHAIGVALMFHERDHGCAAVSVSAEIQDRSTERSVAVASASFTGRSGSSVSRVIP